MPRGWFLAYALINYARGLFLYPQRRRDNKLGWEYLGFCTVCSEVDLAPDYIYIGLFISAPEE